MTKFSDHIYDSTGLVYPIKFLMLQAIIIEVSFYCYDKVAQMHTKLSYIFVIWPLSIFEKSGQMAINTV